jgi:hypothetical protein
MGLIARPTKTGGTTTYTAEVAAGQTVIRAAEVDADLNTIYALVNGNLEDANLADDISGTKLADLSVPYTKLGDLSIPTGKLEVHASSPQIAIASPTTGLAFSTVETTIVTLPAITTRGGRVRLSGVWGVRVAFSTTAGGTVILRIKRNGSVLITVEIGVEAGAVPQSIPLPAPAYTDTPAAGTWTYTITGQTDSASIELHTGAGNTGQVSVEEAA